MRELKPDLTDTDEIESLTAMDDPDNMLVLQELGVLAGDRLVRSGDFASHFDLSSR